MKPQPQRPHVPSLGLIGNCFLACIASILEIETDDIPDFYQIDQLDEGIEGDERFFRELRLWLAEEHRTGLCGVAMVTPDDVEVGADLEAIMDAVAQYGPGLHWILTGSTASGIPHSAVCYESHVVHNPGPDIVSPDESGYYWVYCLTRI